MFVGQKVFIAKDLKFKTAGVVFPKGHIITVTEDLLPIIERNSHLFPLVCNKFPTYPRTPEEEARYVLEKYQGDSHAAFYHVKKKQETYPEFTRAWQYWRLVSIKLWRKYCGVAFRDRRSKPRMKNKGK